MANSERQTIWARNAAMFVGNSFVINAIRSGSLPNDELTFVLCVCGVIVCTLWAVMTEDGWIHLYAHLIDAAGAVPDGEENPFTRYESLKVWNDTIFQCTMGVIALFALMYAATVLLR